MDGRLTKRRAFFATAGVVAMSTGLVAMTAAVVGSRALADEPPAEPGPVAEVRGAFPSVSDDGRWVVFQGRPVDGSDRATTTYLRDSSPAGSTTGDEPVELTRPIDGVPLGNSVHPVISGDGCVVVVVTEMAYDLFRDDDGGARWDVYRRVLPQCGGKDDDWELVSTQSSSAGDTSALDRVSPDDAPAVSQVGSIVAFTHQARPGKDPLLTVSVVDLTIALGQPGRAEVVKGTPLLAPDTTFRYLGQRQPAVSGDGRFVAYTSDADSAASVPEWGTGPVRGELAVSQVYVWDRRISADPLAAATEAQVQLVSGVAGNPSTTGAGHASISDSGRYIAYESAAPELAGRIELPACGTVCPTQVYRFDTSASRTVLVSRTDEPVEGTDGAPSVAADLGGHQPSISDDGTQVAFVTRARNLFIMQSAAGPEGGDGDIVVSEVDRGVVRRVTLLADGLTPATASNAHPDLSGSGHVVVFDTLAADLFGGSSDGGRQVASVRRPAQLVSPALDLGTVGVNLPSDEWYFWVRNEGPSTFLPSVVESSNPDFTVTRGTCKLGLAVPPGSGCSVYVVLKPSLPGPVTGTITVSEALFEGTSITVPISGAGGEPALEVSRPGIDFEATEVGDTSAPGSSDVTNIGFGSTVIAQVSVEGADADDFDVRTTSCVGFPLNPGANCAIDVTFTPTDAGYRTANVVVRNDLGQYATIAVSGVGTLTAELTTATPKVRAGGEVLLGGSGFRAKTVVTLSWADGRGPTIAPITTAADGSFLVVVPTRANTRAGDRVIVAQTTDQMATVDVRISRRPANND
jgi:hypothetical protein